MIHVDLYEGVGVGLGWAKDLVLAANRRCKNMLQTTSIRPARMLGEDDLQIIPRVWKSDEAGT